jgi:polysaccharide export outer membrane protein
MMRLPKTLVIGMSAVILMVCGATLGVPQDSAQPGFGLQPGLVPPKSDPQTLTRRILSTTQYKLTPGDAYELEVILDKVERFPLVLGQDYQLEIPYVGTMNVRGMYFADLKQEILRRIKGRVPVQFVDLLLSAPALFDVFVYGGVKTPGIATVNPLSRVSDAILLAGGLVEGASYRQVKLLRKGSTETVDLSKFATEAALNENPYLEPDDRIYVPQAQTLVEVKGQVKYPGYYELVPGDSLATLVAIAGGTTASGTSSAVQILRQEAGATVALQADLSRADKIDLAHLDVVSVGLNTLSSPARIMIDGALYGERLLPDKPAKIPQDRVVANVPYVKDLTLLDVLDQFGGPSPLADYDKSYVQRQSGEKLPVMLRQLWDGRDHQFDIPLAPGDLIVVPIKPARVFVAGQVNAAGGFPFINGFTVSDYVLAAGGIDLDTGDPKRIFFIDKAGARKRVSMETSVVDSGTIVYVAKNSFALAQTTLTQIAVITGFLAAVITLAANAVDLATRF